MVARRTNNRNEWTREHISILCRGHERLHPDFPWFGGVDYRRHDPEAVMSKAEIPRRHLAEMERAWLALGKGIMAKWDRPGRRPWAWWLFDAPEPRDNNVPQVQQLAALGLLVPGEAEEVQRRAEAEAKYGSPFGWWLDRDGNATGRYQGWPVGWQRGPFLKDVKAAR